ncbi:MAG TPA: HAMP domain-containing sensor histidine kinase, partial [Phycisphaerae bacterium]|nr:HAMP domain-containing sensor histidine kinase [Phycisphaerae bacterium]
RRLLRRLLCVQEETARIQRILDDFLQYAGKVELHAADTDICEVVREMRDFFTPQAEASRIVFRTQLPAQPVICKIDVNLIKQALLNLMINAVQAMNTGGELIVRVTTKGAFANIEVIDSGPGIPPENLNLIFKAYFSTKKSGSGLGLPTARRILKEHGGDMIVESEQGKGTCFLLKLPIVH